ncbi:50S ribosomal protein L9 [candidate division KSB1 bacterium]|nr:50S ribosomal protein L9 [candidate division KSB1 bacterium]
MKIILRNDYESLGKAGEMFTVKDGFARNFLIPKGIAVLATKANMKRLEDERSMNTRQQEKDFREAGAVAKELEKISITATVAVGEEDRVFGSVTTQDIADLIKEKGFEVDKRKINLDEPIKALGVYTVPIKLHSDVEAKVRVWVVKE